MKKQRAEKHKNPPNTNKTQSGKGNHLSWFKCIDQIMSYGFGCAMVMFVSPNNFMCGFGTRDYFSKGIYPDELIPQEPKEEK